MKHVLIVCTGNIARSPIAAGLLTQRLEAAGLGDKVLVRTAGVYAEPGAPVWGPIQNVMDERGVDLQRHRSQAVSSAMVQEADLIIVMEEEHRKSIFYIAPLALRKVFLVSELAGESDPVPDVVGQSPEELRTVCQQIDQWLEDGWSQIVARLALDETTATAH
jgi:protein-tyrosine phosphatase